MGTVVEISMHFWISSDLILLKQVKTVYIDSNVACGSLPTHHSANFKIYSVRHDCTFGDELHLLQNNQYISTLQQYQG